MQWTYLVFLENLAKGRDLGFGEAFEGVNVVAAVEQLALVLGEAALALEGEVGGGGLLGVFGDAALNVGLEVFCVG